MVLAEDLRKAVLQAALQGKLTKQLSTDSDVNKLLDDIRKEKEQLVKDKKIKKEKELEPIKDEDKPFEIPDNWKFLYIKEIFDVKNGFTPKRTNAEFWNNGDIPWFTVEDIHDQGKIINSTKQFITKKALGKTSNRLIPPNTVLLCCTSATIGNYALTNIELTTNQQFNGLVVRDLYKKLIDSKYVLVYVSTLKPKLLKMANSTTFPFLSVDKLNDFIIPLPPIEEQQRIVEKLDILMKEIDEYEVMEKQLEEIKKKFPDDMKNAVLQYALQGKLTKQLSTDSSVEELVKETKKEKEKLIKDKKIKKEKELPLIEEVDMPFEIPDNWKWVYLGDIFMHNAGKALNIKNTKGELKEYLTTSNIYEDRFELDNLKRMYYTDDEIEKYSVKKNDLLVLEGGDVGRTAIWNLEKSYCIQNHVHKLRPYVSTINIKLYCYILNYFKKIGLLKGKGIAIKGLSSNALHSVLIPLPPIEEQQRIVDKLEQILLLIEDLKEK